MPDVNVHDLEAIGDIADWLAEASDGMPTQQAIELLEGALVVQAKLKAAIDMLRAQALNTMEQPILIGNVAWSKKPSFKTRPEYTKISTRVVALASQPDEDGEVPTSYQAANLATRLMHDLYVSPSTVPKVGGVKALGLEMDDVAHDEHTGFELRRTELE